MGLNVIHIARAPMTGVWSVMRNLAIWQRQQGYGVAMGVLVPASWPAVNRAQLEALVHQDILIFQDASPDIFGTAAFLYHSLHNSIADWVAEFQAKTSYPLIVHFHNAWLSGAFLPLAHTRAQVCVTYHGIQGEPNLRKQPLRRWIHAYWARRIERSQAQIVSVDQRAPRVAEQLFGVRADSFQIVPNGVQQPDVQFLGCPRLLDPALPFTVGHVGVIDEGKGWRITADAVEALFVQGHNVRIIIAGSGDEEGAAKEWCDKRPSYARFLGFVAEPVTRVFPRLDVLALPSKREGLPMAILESFSLGIPVIATAVGGIPEAVQDGENGFLIDRSVTEMQKSIVLLMNNLDLLEHLSKAALVLFKKRYSVVSMGEGYERVYKEMA